MFVLQKFFQNVTPWLYDHGVKIAAIIIVAYLVRRFAKIFIEKIIRKVVISNHFLLKTRKRSGKIR